MSEEPKCPKCGGVFLPAGPRVRELAGIPPEASAHVCGPCRFVLSIRCRPAPDFKVTVTVVDREVP